MEKADFKAARVASGMSQEVFGAAVGLSRSSVAQIEAGKLAISPAVADKIASFDPGERSAPTPTKPRAAAAPRTVASSAPDARRLPRPYDFASAPDFARDLARHPSSNIAFGPGMGAMDDRPAGAGWQRIPGCCVICIDTIPEPIPFKAPAWAGARGIITASGRVFHQETGHEMRGGAMPRATGYGQTMGRATPKAPPKAKARR